MIENNSSTMNTNIDIDLLRAFLTVADSGSFTAAARSLNRTQSAISMQIKRLEDNVGSVLFERNSRNVVLTRPGESLFTYARRMVALNDEMLGKLRGQSLAGTVRLGAIEDYAAHALPPILASFMSAHPNVAFEMETGLTSPLLAGLGERFDLVLAQHPKGSGRGERLRCERAVWAGSRQHAVHEQPILPLALHPAGCQFRQAALTALDKAKRPWRLSYVSPSLSALAGAAVAGLAVIVSKGRTVPRGLVVLDQDDGMPALPSFEIALHRAPRSKNQAVVALADHLADALKDGSASP